MTAQIPDVNLSVKLEPGAKLPVYATDGSGCFDLFAYMGDPSVDPCTTVFVVNGAPIAFRTGLSVEVPKGWVMLIFSRSGQAFNANTRLANCVGVIDSDYRGEVRVKLTADSPSSHLTVTHGDRIAQALLMPSYSVGFSVVDSLSSTDRGTGGFGHTGVK